MIRGKNEREVYTLQFLLTEGKDLVILKKKDPIISRKLYTQYISVLIVNYARPKLCFRGESRVSLIITINDRFYHIYMNLE